MSPERQRVVIGDLCGWFFSDRSWHMPNGAKATADGGPDLPPDYLNDLNAIHEAIVSLFKTQTDWLNFEQNLKWVMVKAGRWPNLDIPSWALLSAEAHHICEALLRTLDKWEDSQ